MPDMRYLPIVLVCALQLPYATAGNEMPPRQDAATEYTRRANRPEAERCTPGETAVLDVASDTQDGLEISFDADKRRLHVRYRMDFNHVTEGWNWHPDDAMTGNDYYRFKYLPLGSAEEVRGTYRDSGITGQPQEYQVKWRYDYYFTFDNPDDFYDRKADADSGFHAEIAVAPSDAARLMQGDLRMALRALLTLRCVTDSTTYWRGIPARPVDFTLKKRYLIGKLAEVDFYDIATGNMLARLLPTRLKSSPD